MEIDINDGKIAVIGLGYVGLPLAIEFGKSREVIGFDINQLRISELLSGRDSTLEISDDELSSAKFITYTNNVEMLLECGIFIITVPTPIDKAKRPDLTPLVKATEMVSKVIKPGALIIYESTVYPGCTEEVCVPIIEKYSGLKYNVDFYCGYSPERIVPGDKVHTLTNIKKITSGSNEQAAHQVNLLYSSIIKAGTWVASSIKVAEAAKVIENCQRDLNIAFVNELSIIFDRLGIDTMEVLEAAGSKWNFLPFRPGLVGGHCIGVDPYYLTHKAEELGYHPQVILGGRHINDNMATHAAHNFIKHMVNNGINISKCTVAIFGITFKDNCPDIRNSKVIDLIVELKKWGIIPIVIDPWADQIEVKNEYGVELTSLDLVKSVDSILVPVAHDQFKNLDLNVLRSICISSNPVLGDLKSIFSKNEAESHGFTVYRF